MVPAKEMKSLKDLGEKLRASIKAKDNPHDDEHIASALPDIPLQDRRPVGAIPSIPPPY